MNTAQHSHEHLVVVDPMDGHEWEFCSCGYSNDLTVMRGRG